MGLLDARASTPTLQAQVLAKPIEGVKVQKLLETYGSEHLDQLSDQQVLRLYAS